MSGDWIKMRSGLLTNPKVIRMSRLLAADRNFMAWWTRGSGASCKEIVYEICDVTVVTRVTVASLLPVWSAVNDVAGPDGTVKGVTLRDVDEMAGVPGFGAAMAAIGWARETKEGVVFPNFSEHNSVAKERSTGALTGAERTKAWRARQKRNVTSDVNSDVTVTSQRDHREEKNNIPPISPVTPVTGQPTNYAFEGTVIRLTRPDLDRWIASFVNIPNLIALLESRDAWFAENPDRQKGWFRSTAAWLAKKDAESVDQKAAGQPTEPSAEEAAARAKWEAERDEREAAEGKANLKLQAEIEERENARAIRELDAHRRKRESGAGPPFAEYDRLADELPPRLQRS